MIKKPRKGEGDSGEISGTKNPSKPFQNAIDSCQYHTSLASLQLTTEILLDQFKPAVPSKKQELLHACSNILQKRRDDLVDCFFSEHNLVSFFLIYINKLYF